MTEQVLLNGQYVDAATIDPARHRYLGMFRPATNGLLHHSADVVICPCGASLWTVQDGRQHYKDGCLDSPQYVTIES